ncbi:hypothetical protein Tsubulata_017290 [Turnera subulata]|uniref:DIS3-like exonuclease 2 n=1 Tax=Turnera subulata TaxID=218843 RepID=A0A9Q0F5M2_9ROSI|nr:hypothetical protein Tsubulata_017290 [Turnera subulata]
MHPASGSAGEVNGELLQPLANGGKTKNCALLNCATSLRQQLDLDMQSSVEHGPSTASNVSFSSLPAMLVSEQAEAALSPELDGLTLVKSCPEPIAGGAPLGKCARKDLVHSHHFECQGQTKIFTPHWPMEAVNKSLEKGDVFKALFRVNAHNRLEAYCKIEGVGTDVLISGIPAQNRAVEGDIVVIKVDPLSLWTKMKGSNGQLNNVCLAENSNSQANGAAGKTVVGGDLDLIDSGSSLLPQKGITCVDSSSSVDQNLNVPGGCNFINSNQSSVSDNSLVPSSIGRNEASNGLERLCAMINSYPSKRPTARVVAIVDQSPRRDAVIGFLNVKQWIYYRARSKKEAKRNNIGLSISNNEYIELVPTDPRFPKMMVPVKGLPECIMKRLNKGDETVEMELIAAQVDNWDEDSPFPQARVTHVFGRGSEMESQINAILHENAICDADFPPEALNCLPSNIWEVPPEEFKRRRDLRNMCIFTIDPSTATDLDDALSVERLPDGTFRVGVHIADASYFVLPDTALDKEAQVRSTSVYMLLRKIPMLPPLLSENLGSLNPGKERLAFSMFWDLNSSGSVIDRWIGRTVIRSCCKLSYEHAQDILDGIIDSEAYDFSDDGLPQLHGHFEWSDVTSSVKWLFEISKTLKEKRFRDGALQLESCKIVFLFDEYGIPYDSMLCGWKDSNCIVEEFMLLANRTAAEVISRAFPDNALLRRHPEPNMRKLKEFEAFCCKHGLELDTSSSGEFHRLLERIKEKLKDDSMLCDILINHASRPMQLATYFCTGDLKDKIKDWGHYALAVPLYTHFTSPLRRYPDIVVHRALAAAIEAEELYTRQRRLSYKVRNGEEVKRCFTGISFDKHAAESVEGREALSAAAIKHRIPCSKLLGDVVAYCNERKLASRHVKDACDKLYMWVLLKKKEIDIFIKVPSLMRSRAIKPVLVVLLSEARVLALGPRFMSIYIRKLGIERRINYEEVEGLSVEWLEATSTLVLNLRAYRQSFRRTASGFQRALDEVAWVINPCDLKLEPDITGDAAEGDRQHPGHVSGSEIYPVVSPLTVRPLSTIPVVLHAVGGDDGPLDIGVRLYMSSYFG